MTMANLLDLNDRLFRELDRLENAEGDALEVEIERAKAISEMAMRVIDNAGVVIRAAQVQQQAMDDTASRVIVPRLLMDASVPTCAERSGSA